MTTTPTLPPGETKAERVRATHLAARRRRSCGARSVDSFVKLNPRHLMRNPVMFVVEVGSVLTTILFFTDLGSASTDENVFAALVAVFLWFTVLFANFAEAVAEGRGKAQADTLRKTRSETMANRRRADGSIEEVPGTQLDLGDEVVVVAGEVIPSDGDVVEGIASIDESAITGESAPVIREAGGDRSAVTGGTRVLSDRIVVRITARPGRDVHRPDDRPRRGLRAPEDPERDRAQHPARRAHDHLPARDGEPAAVRDLRERRAVGRRARRAARLPDPHDDRRAALRDRHRGHGPAGAPQRARDERPRGRGRRRREHAAARQDRARSPTAPARRPSSARRPASTSASSPTPRCCRASPTRRRRVARSSSSPRSATGIAPREVPGAELVAFTAQTRMSGVDYDGHSIRKGAADSVRRWVEEHGGTVPDRADGRGRRDRRPRRHAARRRDARTAPRPRRSA